MVALSLSDKFCCFGNFCVRFQFFFIFNRFLFSRFSFHHFFVLVLVFFNEFVIFSFFTIFVFVYENHTAQDCENSPVHRHTVWYLQQTQRSVINWTTLTVITMITTMILQMQRWSANNRYRPIIGRFAGNQHQPIITLVSADCHLHNCANSEELAHRTFIKLWTHDCLLKCENQM